jgi:hypothetical protein
LSEQTPPPSSPPEFRSYRRFLSGLVLTFVSVGSAYLLTSVGVTLYRERRAVATGTSDDAPGPWPTTAADVRSCQQQLSDVFLSLQKHLEKFHYLLGGYDTAEAQRWAEEGVVWRTQWSLLGDRCRFRGRVGGPRSRELEALAGVWRELEETDRVYTRALSRFGQEQAPRLDRIRDRLNTIGERLEAQASAPGEAKP